MKPLNEQVVVITGASSGIGRATAVEFGRRGASVVLAARNEVALRETARQVEEAGGRAHVTLADVAEWPQVERLAMEAADTFGAIDTWVNNASVAEYATLEDITVEEIDRLVQVILLGAIYGSKAALPHLKRAGGGTIINVGSILSKRSVPLLSIYDAGKHGVKGFTQALRLEMERERTGINVTLVMPASMNTPFFDHARSRMGVRPGPIPPVYEPGVVAEAIVFAAEHPRREIIAGGAGNMLIALERLSPRLLDALMLPGGAIFKLQQTDEPDDGIDNLFEPVTGPGAARGHFGRFSLKRSLYTRALELHPARKRVLLGAALAGAVTLLRRAGR